MLLVDLAKYAIRTEPLCYFIDRKLFNSMNFEATELPEIEYEAVGYKRANKHGQLLRNYWNEAEAERVRKVLHHPRQTLTSAAMSMRGEAKKREGSMGWCINTIVVTRVPRVGEFVEIQYRSTELIKKFAGDLCFLPWVFEQLELNPVKINFRFANAHFSGGFLPTLFRFWKWENCLAYLLANDKKLFQMGTRLLMRSATGGPDQTFKFSAANNQHQLAWKTLGRKDMNRVGEYLTQVYKRNGWKTATSHDTEMDDDG